MTFCSACPAPCTTCCAICAAFDDALTDNLRYWQHWDENRIRFMMSQPRTRRMNSNYIDACTEHIVAARTLFRDTCIRRDSHLAAYHPDSTISCHFQRERPT